MQIDLSSEQYAKLTEVAISAGYGDATALVKALVEEPTVDPRGPLTDQERRDSLAQIDRSMAEFDAGGGQDAEEAFLKMASRRGFDLGE